MFPAKIRKACTAKPHWANIRSTLQNGRSSVCAFICIRLTSAFWLPFAPSPCNREQVGKRKDKTKKKKEERPDYFSRRETDWKRCVRFFFLSLFLFYFFPFFFALLVLVTKHRSFTLNYQSSFWLKPVSRLCEPNRPGCSWLGSRKDKGLLRNPRCA